MYQKKYLILVSLILLSKIESVSISPEDRFGEINLEFILDRKARLGNSYHLPIMLKFLNFCVQDQNENHQVKEIWNLRQKDQITTELVLNDFFINCKNSNNWSNGNNDKNYEDYIKNLEGNFFYFNLYISYVQNILIASNRMIKEFVGGYGSLENYIHSNPEIILRKTLVFANREGNENERLEFHLGQLSIIKIVQKIIRDIFKDFPDGNNYLVDNIQIIVQKEGYDFITPLINRPDIPNRNFMFYFLIVPHNILFDMSGRQDNTPTPIQTNYLMQQNFFAQKIESLLNEKASKMSKSLYLTYFFVNLKNSYDNNTPVNLSSNLSQKTSRNVFIMNSWEILDNKKDHSKRFNYYAHDELEQIFVGRALSLGTEISPYYYREENGIKISKREYMIYYTSNCRGFGGDSRII